MCKNTIVFPITEFLMDKNLSERIYSLSLMDKRVRSTNMELFEN